MLHYATPILRRSMTAATAGVFEFEIPVSGKIVDIRINSKGIAIANADAVFDANLNGTTLYTDQSTRPKIVIGQHTVEVTPSFTVTKGQFFRLDLDDLDVGTGVGDPLSLTVIIDDLRGSGDLSDPDTSPLTANAMDDEFLGASLDPKWSWFNQSSSSLNFNTPLPSWLEIVTTDLQWRGIGQPVPSGTWNIRTRLSMGGAGVRSAGLVLVNTTTGASESVSIYNTDGAVQLRAEAWNSFSSFNIQRGVTNGNFHHGWLEIGWNGTSYSYKFSTDGLAYRFFTSVAAGLSPNIIGIGVRGNSAPVTATFDWFRRVA